MENTLLSSKRDRGGVFKAKVKAAPTKRGRLMPLQAWATISEKKKGLMLFGGQHASHNLACGEITIEKIRQSWLQRKSFDPTKQGRNVRN